MALAADRNYETSGLTEKIRVTFTAPDIYYKGAILVFAAATGLAKVAANIAAEGRVAGVCVRQYNVAAGQVVQGEIEIGKIWIPDAAAAQADVGDYCYATDDDTIAMAGAGDAVGKVVDVRVGVARLVDFRCGVPATALV